VSLPRLRLESCVNENGTWLIDAGQAKHLVKVRRCYSGSLVEGLLDGEKIELRLRCDADGTVHAEEVSRSSEAPMTIELHLLLALLKNDQFDDALRFAAETGVHTIHLLACERSVPKINDKIDEKMARWNKVLAESTKQAGAAAVPEITKPIPFQEFDFASLPNNRYAALLSQKSVPLIKINISSPAVVAIGPEGDWSPQESAALLAAGFAPVSLGRRILRASTAVAVACGWFANAGEK
jgi:16S rRNA (uracil1498-N3)-methyltransferase